MLKQLGFSLAMTILGSSQLQARQVAAKPGAGAPSQMSMGVLAIVSDHGGAIFVDGQLTVFLEAGKVVTLELTAGQHIVDMSDKGGIKLWEGTVAIPIGAQVVQGIQVPEKLNTDISSKGLAKSELGTPIARNHEEIEQLRRISKRDYTEFTITGRNRPLKVANVTLELTDINADRQFSLAMTVEGKRFDKKNRDVNQPIFLFASGVRGAEEVVINKVGKDSIGGYVSVPTEAANALQSARLVSATDLQLTSNDQMTLLDRTSAAVACAMRSDCTGQVLDVRTDDVAKYCKEPEAADAATRQSDAMMCAGVRYDRGEYEKALAKVNEVIETIERHEQTVRSLENQIRSLGSQPSPLSESPNEAGAMLYSLRGRVKYGLSDISGALADLKTARVEFETYSRNVRELIAKAEAASPSQVSPAQVSSLRQFFTTPDPNAMEASISEAVIFFRTGRYFEALDAYNAYAAEAAKSPSYHDTSAEKLGRLISAHLRSQIPAGNITGGGGTRNPATDQQSSQPVSTSQLPQDDHQRSGGNDSSSQKNSQLTLAGGTANDAKVFSVSHMLQSGGGHAGQLTISTNRVEWHESTERYGGNPIKDNFSVQCREIKTIGKAGFLASFKGNSYGGSEFRLDLFKKNYLLHAQNDDERDAILAALLGACPRQK